MIHVCTTIMCNTNRAFKHLEIEFSIICIYMVSISAVMDRYFIKVLSLLAFESVLLK